MLEIENVQFCTNESTEVILERFQGPRVRKTGEVVLIPADHASDPVALSMIVQMATALLRKLKQLKWLKGKQLRNWHSPMCITQTVTI